MPWWTCFSCTSRTTQTNCNDVIILDYAHHSLHDVPADVFQYERTLEELYLSSNRITELPRQLFLCHGLKVLDLSDNDISSIPTAVSTLTNVRKINLARNSLTRLTDWLTELYLNDTFLEYLPANFGRLTNLRILELRDNNLITLPQSMNRLLSLKRLDIGNNEFNELPEVIGNLLALTELWCDGNRIRRFNCNIGNLKELIHFDGSNNLLQYLPTEIGSWSQCQELCVSANEIEELPFSIGMMKSLVALKIDENQLQELPDSICEMEKLEELMVSHNDLFKLPSTIGLLRRLRFLTADENLIRMLPNEICSCSNLTILSVRGNKLSKVPVDIGRLTQLRVLNIVNNFITHLPATIVNLTQLSALWISDNQSQPLMPLQKEFNKESQCYYLTCYLLPQIYSNTPPNNAASTSTAPESTYDYYPPSTCDGSEQNMHMAALESLALVALDNRKRRICFASDPPQELPPNLRLMRSPTPYPKELRLMQAKFAANKNTQQYQLRKQYAQQHENDINNLDKQPNTKLLNTMNSDDLLNMQSHQTFAINDTVDHFHDTQNMNHLNMTDSGMMIPPAQHLPPLNQPYQSVEHNPVLTHSNVHSNQNNYDLYSSGRKLQTPNQTINNDIVQYNSLNLDTMRILPSEMVECKQNTVALPNHDIGPEHYSLPATYEENDESIHQQVPMLTDSNDDTDMQQPPPYHIARAFTKKSKQDLLIYDIYRTNYQQGNQPNQTQNDHQDNSIDTPDANESNSTISSFKQVDADNNEVNVHDTTNHSQNNSLLVTRSKTPWLFGEHKNPTVMQLSVPKLKIIKDINQGIFISDVEKHSSAFGKLSVKDKILDVDGVDFTKISLVDAETVLSNAGSIINIMVSRDK